MDEFKGNIVKLAKDKHFDLIIHGCNCLKNFGAGLALDVKKKFL